MSSAGQQVLGNRISGERIETDIDTADSANVTTTETAVMSVTAALVSGRTYAITWRGKVGTSQASVFTVIRLREDSAAGTQMQVGQVLTPSTAANTEYRMLYAEYTAVATANKTFVFTIVRGTGTGNHFLDAGATDPAYLSVDYLSG